MNIYKKILNILDLRKYFFSYIYILLGTGAIIFLALTLTIEPPYFLLAKVFPLVKHNDDIIFFISFFFSIILFFYVCGLLTIEILIRNLFLEPFFEKFKKPFRYSKSDKLNKSLTIVFWVFFAFSSIVLYFYIITLLKIHSINN